MPRTPTPDFDIALTDQDYVGLRIGPNGPYVNFQYPPIVTSDNKGGNWKELDVKGPEPLGLFMGGKAREISLDWIYVVTNEKTSSNNARGRPVVTWNIDTIAREVKQLRGYYYAGAVVVASQLIVYMNIYNIVGQPSSNYTFRMDSVNVSHGDTLIRDGNKVYPLHTKIGLKLKLWTQGNTGSQKPPEGSSLAEEAKTATEDKDKAAKGVDLNLLKPNPTEIVWY